MTWAKLDDRANEHEKQLAAGPKACWLWACGLMYANRQSRKTGRIPKTVVHAGMLYPGLGKPEALKLVEVGLWHDAGDAYEVHEYLGWNPELRAKRAEAGRLGGQRSAETRRAARAQAPPEANDEANTKQLASANASNAEASDEARAQPRAYARTAARGIHPTPPHEEDQIRSATTIQRPGSLERPADPAVVVGDESEARIPCPADLDLTDGQKGQLEANKGIYPWAMRVMRDEFVAAQLGDPQKTMTRAQWRKVLSMAMCSRWSDRSRWPKRPEEGPSVVSAPIMPWRPPPAPERTPAPPNPLRPASTKASNGS